MRAKTLLVIKITCWGIALKNKHSSLPVPMEPKLYGFDEAFH
ncbi:hypothetical protein [Bartonella vinsonii]|nr:hypothetical protein [Bartonella vinsonii]